MNFDSLYFCKVVHLPRSPLYPPLSLTSPALSLVSPRMLCTRKPLQGWMSIVYSLVARGTVVLAEYVLGDYVGNFSAVNNLLSKLEAEANIPETGSFTFESKDPDRGTSRKFAFHYLHKSHLIFVALCDLTFSRQNVFLFLNHIHSEFVGR